MKTFWVNIFENKTEHFKKVELKEFPFDDALLGSPACALLVFPGSLHLMCFEKLNIATSHELIFDFMFQNLKFRKLLAK